MTGPSRHSVSAAVAQPAAVRLPVLIGSVAILFAGLAGYSWARLELPKARYALAAADIALSDAHRQVTLAERQRVLRDAQESLEHHATALETTPATWSERVINLRQQHLKREEINALLGSIERTRTQVLLPEEFELSVERIDEGLFQEPELQAQPLLMTLRGTVLFRTAEGVK